MKNLTSGTQFCQASIPMMKVGTQKLSLVAALIRGMKAQEAMIQLKFCKKRISTEVMSLLASCIANAVNNHGMSQRGLIVSEVLIGKSFGTKRMIPRAKGKGDRLVKHFSRLTIILKDITKEVNFIKETIDQINNTEKKIKF